VDRRQAIRDHLARAKGHIRAVEARIDRQQTIVRDLERRGQIVQALRAVQVLRHLNELQQQHVINHERWAVRLEVRSVVSGRNQLSGLK
jgi:hypothetical protein